MANDMTIEEKLTQMEQRVAQLEATLAAQRAEMDANAANIATNRKTISINKASIESFMTKLTNAAAEHAAPMTDTFVDMAPSAFANAGIQEDVVAPKEGPTILEKIFASAEKQATMTAEVFMDEAGIQR